MHQFARSYPHYPHPARTKPKVAAEIALRPIAHVVTNPVDLDCEPRPRAKEVQNIRPDRMLPAEYRLSGRASAQSDP
jgi:hypothetical protein